MLTSHDGGSRNIRCICCVGTFDQPSFLQGLGSGSHLQEIFRSPGGMWWTEMKRLHLPLQVCFRLAFYFWASRFKYENWRPLSKLECSLQGRLVISDGWACSWVLVSDCFAVHLRPGSESSRDCWRSRESPCIHFGALSHPPCDRWVRSA